MHLKGPKYHGIRHDDANRKEHWDDVAEQGEKDNEIWVRVQLPERELQKHRKVPRIGQEHERRFCQCWLKQDGVFVPVTGDHYVQTMDRELYLRETQGYKVLVKNWRKPDDLIDKTKPIVNAIPEVEINYAPWWSEHFDRLAREGKLNEVLALKDRNMKAALEKLQTESGWIVLGGAEHEDTYHDHVHLRYTKFTDDGRRLTSRKGIGLIGDREIGFIRYAEAGVIPASSGLYRQAERRRLTCVDRHGRDPIDLQIARDFDASCEEKWGMPDGVKMDLEKWGQRLLSNYVGELKGKGLELDELIRQRQGITNELQVFGTDIRTPGLGVGRVLPEVTDGVGQVGVALPGISMS